MKSVSLFFLVWVALLSGCLSTPERSAAHRLASYSPKGPYGEVVAACYGYFSRTGNWPESSNDLRQGLKAVGRTPEHLDFMRKLTLTETNSALSVSFISNDGAAGDLELVPPKPQSPNKAPEPTTTAVTPRAP